jgi:hypothetical protein
MVIASPAADLLPAMTGESHFSSVVLEAIKTVLNSLYSTELGSAGEEALKNLRP